MQVLTRGFLLSDAREKGDHPGRRERKPVCSHAFSTDWRESFVPEPSSHANYLLNLSITWDAEHLKWLKKWWHHCTGEISIDHSIHVWKYCARWSKFYRQREKNSAILNLFSDLKNLHGRKGKLYITSFLPSACKKPHLLVMAQSAVPKLKTSSLTKSY